MTAVTVMPAKESKRRKKGNMHIDVAMTAAPW
jgi:hypothetical protein